MGERVSMEEAVKNAAAEVQGLLLQTQKELDRLADEVVKCTDGLETAGKDATAAAAADDFDAYKEARLRADMLTERRDMLEARILELENEPLISPADYNRIRQEIMAAITAAENAERETVRAFLCQLREQHKDLSALAVHAQRTMKQLHADLYRETMLNSSGVSVPTAWPAVTVPEMGRLLVSELTPPERAALK